MVRSRYRADNAGLARPVLTRHAVGARAAARPSNDVSSRRLVSKAAPHLQRRTRPRSPRTVDATGFRHLRKRPQTGRNAAISHQRPDRSSLLCRIDGQSRAEETSTTRQPRCQPTTASTGTPTTATCHPPRRDDADPHHVRDDARFHRSRGGRPHSPASRTARGVAGDPPPSGLPPRRCRRNGRVLGEHPGHSAACGTPRPIPAADAAPAARIWHAEQVVQGRLHPAGGRGRPPPAHLDGDGLRATPRRRGQGGPAEGRHPDDRRVHALPLLFEEQDLAYKRAVMGDPCSRGRGRRRSNSAGSAISASRAASLGCTASASPARSDVYKKFDITTDAVVRWWLTAAAPA